MAKLPTLISNSLSGNFNEPLLFNNNGVELGVEFRDLIFDKQANGILEFSLFSKGSNLQIKITSDNTRYSIPKIVSWKLDNKADFVYNDLSKSYTNLIDKEEYSNFFKGFHLESSNKNDGSDNLLSTSNFKLDTDYIGPFRVIPPRIFALTGQNRYLNVGVKGEHAYQIITNDFLYNNRKVLKEVNNWFKENFEGWGISVNEDRYPFYQIELTRDTPRFDVNIVDVGQGMSQVFPLVVRAFMPTNPILIILEQPELHLHPGAHGNLAELFAKSTKDNNRRYLIETHSQNFVLRIRRLIAENRFNPNDVGLYWVDYDESSNSSSLKKISINELGEVDYWPENIFSETLDETIAIKTAQNKQERK